MIFPPLVLPIDVVKLALKQPRGYIRENQSLNAAKDKKTYVV